ncbi:conjugal transfer protein TraA [Streptomyces sp. AC1-42W]|nr:conjugal transfer protein TraA [Streptomyces sp. AC1-42T]PZT83896.1 conjugal transfer protein TraA [Streptomyces sp. AC1-42W]
MRIVAEDSKMISLPRVRLARALGVTDPELVMVETDGMASGVVSVYREHPLINIREATVEDLTMRPDGTIALGLCHDGRVARIPLYDPELGAITDLVVGAPGSGKSVTLNTILAAERISSVVSIVADAQNGMSLPEANGRVFHFGAGIAALGATLAAACAVADYRETVSSANGWGAFALGEPWALVNVSLDEINRVLGAEVDVPQEYRKWITGMIGRFQLTGRKLGMGLRFAGQSIHVADLGDAEKIRANAKNGTVWLGRVNSSTTKSMASDMVTDGTEVTPIPKHFGSVAADVEAAWTGEEVPRGPVTAGRAWLIQGGKCLNTRVFKAVKENRTFPGLIALYESAPIPQLTPEEAAVFQRAYTVALDAAERFLAGEDADTAEGGETGAQRPAAPAAGPVPPSAPRTLRDRILDALADGPRRTREIRTAVGVGTPDGPASGTVDNTLGKLRDEGLVTQPTRGTWSLTTG